MEVQPDFRDLLALLNRHQVDYLIVGAYALAYHGAPRYTGDIGIYVRPGVQNAQHVMRALDEFGFRLPDLTEADFLEPRRVVQLGVPPVRVDLLTSISGVPWDEAESTSEPGEFGDPTIRDVIRRPCRIVYRLKDEDVVIEIARV